MVKIMAIVNVTPDSFFAPSRVASDAVRDRLLSLVAAGADIIDIGAVSTRPGASPVTLEEEWRRLLPALEAWPGGAELSVDTTSSEIVRRTYEAVGRFIVNDISAGEDDSRMLPTVAELGLPYVAMHKRGDPSTMDSLTDYGEAGVVAAELAYFNGFSRKAAALGISDWILDPGFGFAKTDAQNLELLHALPEFRRFGRPVLVGISRKRFTHGRTAAYHLEAILRGADIIRMHI